MVSGIKLHSDFDVFVYPEPWLQGLPHNELKHLFNNVNHIYLNFKRNFFGPAPKYDITGYMNLIDNLNGHPANPNPLNGNSYLNYMNILFPNLNRIKEIVQKNYGVINYFLKMHIIKIELRKVEVFKIDKSDVLSQFDCVHKRQPNILKFNFHNKSIATAFDIKIRIRMKREILRNLMKINFSTVEEINNFDRKTVLDYDLAIDNEYIWVEQGVIIGGKSSCFIEFLLLNMKIKTDINIYFIENDTVIEEFNYNN